MPFWGRDNEQRNLRPLLVKAIFEFSSSSPNFVIPTKLCTPVKKVPPAAKAKPRNDMHMSNRRTDTVNAPKSHSVLPNRALPSVSRLSKSCSLDLQEDIQLIVGLHPHHQPSSFQKVCAVVMQRLAICG